MDTGEREAIVLAEEHAGSLLLINERRGRRYAIAAGLLVVGTAGMLLRAKRSGAVETVRPTLDALRARSFRLGGAVYSQTLLAAGEPHQLVRGQSKRIVHASFRREACPE